MKMERNMEPLAVLKKPYARVVVPEADGSFTAEILEFPGCVASGETPADALANVEDVALDWIAATLEQGQDIPEPLDHGNYSGKLVVRMTRGLHKRAARAAEREGVSLNQFIVTCIAEQVGTRARPVAMYAPAIANFSIQVGIGGGVTGMQLLAGSSQLPQQVTTTVGQPFLPFPALNRREAVRA
jgi:predicted RNase H-like HicB family nuclease